MFILSKKIYLSGKKSVRFDATKACARNVVHNYGSEPEMTEIDIDRLSDIEDFKAILKLHDEAKEFLEDHIWCKKTLKSWYDFGIADKIGIFLFQIEPNNSETDSFIWVIVGDLP